jgi:phosphoribosylformimino-5-aminoimidazole carboxamide ribotide isomerase
MIAVPAVDLRKGRCVQLRGGDPLEEKVSLADPVAVARRWWDCGFGSLHIVDLDAALGDGDNRDLVGELLTATPADTQVGGGVRSVEHVQALLASGADRVVVGTRALEDPEWLAELSRTHPGRIVLAADTRDGVVLQRGWTESTSLSIDDLFATTASLRLGGILCTDVGREGRMNGIATETVRPLIESCPHPVWISGGITTLEELRILDRWGARGAVLGMALYTSRIDAGAVAREFGT